MDTSCKPGPAMAKRRERRRRYLINPAFQWKFAVWIMLDVFVACLFVGVLLAVLQEEQLRAQILNPQSSRSGAMAVMLGAFALGFATIAAAGFGLWSIMVTHRLCGPLYVIEECLNELHAGRFPKWRALRKKDEFKEFYAHFWRAIHSLKDMKQADRDALTGILQSLRSAADADEIARQDMLKNVELRIASLRNEAARALGEDAGDAKAVRRAPAGGLSTSERAPQASRASYEQARIHQSVYAPSDRRD